MPHSLHLKACGQVKQVDLFIFQIEVFHEEHNVTLGAFKIPNFLKMYLQQSGHIHRPAICWSISSWSQQLGLGPADTRRPGRHPGLPHRWQQLCLNHHLPLPRCVSTEVDWQHKLYPTQDIGVQSRDLTCCIKVPKYYLRYGISKFWYQLGLLDI